MNDTMIHRGPDDAGAEVIVRGDGWHIGLAQRRLSILDLSAQGHQPMHSADDRIRLVYNGEIYNYQEIAAKIPEYHFVSTCDTEVIIAAYLKWGIRKAVEQFNGMFAFALYDSASGELYLVRDRMGVKPLFYRQDGDGIVFASELKPIMSCPGFTGRVRRDVLARYLFQQYINAPESIFEDVYQQEPGTILTFRAGKLSVEKYWDVADVYHRMASDPVTDYGEAKAELKNLLQKAVKRRLIADVPLGCFLSGGYDSSLVSALAQEQLGTEPLKTFSIGFAEKEYDESGYAREVAKHLGTEHRELVISEPEMFDLVASIPQYFDQPMADSSQIPTMLVSALARQNVTVALSGDAGDEFFCGYNNYDDVALAQKLDAAGAAAHAFGRLFGIEDRYPTRVKVISRNRSPETKTQFFGMGSYIDAALAMLGNDPALLPVNYPVESRYREHNWQIRRMLLDMDTYLPGDILQKVDRASMKYSLESRCPILDLDVMEYSFRIPQKFKYRDGVKKYILKDIAYDYIPKELLERKKKGFGVPLDKWMRGPLRPQLEAYADPSFLKNQGLFEPDFTSGLILDYLKTGDGGPATGRNWSKMAWSFFVFQQWYEHYL